MNPVDVVAVVGICAPERRAWAERTCAATGRRLITSLHTTIAADLLEDPVAHFPDCADRGAVVELPVQLPVHDAIGILAAEQAPTRLSGVVCLVDAPHVMADLGRTHGIDREERFHGQILTVPTPMAHLLVEQIEYASTVVLANAQRMEPRDLEDLCALLAHLSPQAHLLLEGLEHHPAPGPEREAVPADGGTYSPEQVRQGWVQLLNGTHLPEHTSPRVSAFRYEQLRPFHPGRLHQTMEHIIETREHGHVVRSCGFCHLATRPGITGQWMHVGAVVAVDPLAWDPMARAQDQEAVVPVDTEALCAGQELGIIGLDLDHRALAAALDAAALTDAELTADAHSWSAFPDPFPAWALQG